MDLRDPADLERLLGILRAYGVVEYSDPCGMSFKLAAAPPRTAGAPVDEHRSEKRPSRALELLPGAREVGGDDPEVAS